MATRYDACPTCTTQIATNYCDNCKTDIAKDTSPAVTGRVWDPARQGYFGIDLCATCSSTNVNLLDVITTDEPAPTE